MKLDPERNVEDMKAGKFVIIEGDKNDFFSMVTDMRLDSTGLEVLLQPPEREEELLREVLSGTSTYSIVAMRPHAHDAAGRRRQRQGRRRRRPEAGEGDSQSLLHGGGGPGGGRGADLRQRGRRPAALLQHRQPAGHGDARVHRLAALRRAQQRHLREDGDGQVLSHQTRPVRADPLQPRRQPHLRHAQRIRLQGHEGDGRRQHDLCQGLEAVVRGARRHLLTRPQIHPGPGHSARLRGLHLLRPDRGRGHRPPPGRAQAQPHGGGVRLSRCTPSTRSAGCARC